MKERFWKKNSKENWPLKMASRTMPSLFIANNGQVEKSVGRVLIASENRRKIGTLNLILDGLEVWSGCNLLNQAESVETVGEEPSWDRADKVARDKVDNVINVISGQAGSESLVFGSDVVVWINEEAYTNLSREGNLTGRELKREVTSLAEIFKTPTRVMWDVAVAASRKGGKVSLTNRYVVDFEALPKEKVERLFWGDIPGALGRNTRIPLIDECQEEVLTAWMVPFNSVLSKRGEEFLPKEDWSSQLQKVESIELIKDSVLGGFPFGRLVNEFFEAPATKDNSWHSIEELIKASGSV